MSSDEEKVSPESEETIGKHQADAEEPASPESEETIGKHQADAEEPAADYAAKGDAEDEKGENYAEGKRRRKSKKKKKKDEGENSAGPVVLARKTKLENINAKRDFQVLLDI